MLKNKKLENKLSIIDRRCCEALAENIELKEQLRLLQESYENQKNINDDLQNVYNETRRLKHDIRNHLLVIASYLNEEKNAEMCVALNALRLYEELHLTGGLLRVGGEVAAFTLGTPANEDTFVVHVEKARNDIDAAYTMINQQFVIHEIVDKYKYVNREDDVGMEGLRRAKLSYQPEFLVEKGFVTEEADL